MPPSPVAFRFICRLILWSARGVAYSVRVYIVEVITKRQILFSGKQFFLFRTKLSLAEDFSLRT